VRSSTPSRCAKKGRAIDRTADRFFAGFPPDASPGALDAMRLLDEIALQGVHFPAPLFFLRKIFFTLDGVLSDITDGDFRIDTGHCPRLLTAVRSH
jgi:hypothetical protein